MRYDLDEYAREIWQEELEDFVPAEIFDAHTHIWDEQFATAETPESSLRYNAGFAAVRNFSQQLFPGRRCSFLLLGTPVLHIRQDAYREWCLQQAQQSQGQALAGVLLTPEISAEALSEAVRSHDLRVVKPYRCYAADQDNCRIKDFLPERLLEVADHYHLTVVLHLSRLGGCADADNLADLKLYTRKYPGITWQLAHCARAFNAALLEKSIFQLREMERLCYDTSAVCDLYSLFVLLKYEDRSRIFYGSDAIVASGMCGNYCTWGRAWAFFPGDSTATHCDSRTIPVAYENLRCLKRAAEMLGLSSKEIANIFYHNAQQFYCPQ